MKYLFICAVISSLMIISVQAEEHDCYREQGLNKKASYRAVEGKSSYGKETYNYHREGVYYYKKNQTTENYYRY